ncbi:MAG: glycine cleavage system protein H [Desulfobacterales bacterium]|nr:glycine cleavage system protein H [Desulfobacterales bacterium]
MARAIRESMKIVPPGKKKCVWMEAGVVSYKLCDNNFDCTTCSYDHGMDAKVARQKEANLLQADGAQSVKTDATWVEKMMMLPASQRKCRYMTTGEIDRKLCPNAYACGNCSFDQMMQQRLQAEVLPIQAPAKVSGFDLAEGFYYHEGHTWARPEYGGRIRVGLDDFAQKLIGKNTRIELPEVGKTVNQGNKGFFIKRNGQEVEVLAPVDGVIAHVNHMLIDNPELVSESPYEKGWLFIVEPTKMKKNLKSLYYGEEALAFVNEEREKLFAMANEDLNLAADGGTSVENIFEEIEGKDWEKLVKTFLKT